MDFLEASDIAPTGNRLMDSDHMRLMNLVNKLLACAQEPVPDPRRTETALLELISYTKAHFTHEETLMRKTAYPKFLPHKISHDRLTTQIEDFQKRLASGQTVVSQDTLLFFRTWLCDHISTIDVQLGEWLTKVVPSAQDA